MVIEKGSVPRRLTGPSAVNQASIRPHQKSSTCFNLFQRGSTYFKESFFTVNDLLMSVSGN